MGDDRLTAVGVAAKVGESVFLNQLKQRSSLKTRALAGKTGGRHNADVSATATYGSRTGAHRRMLGTERGVT